MTIHPKGIIPPMVTPLDKDENVDKKAIGRVVNMAYSLWEVLENRMALILIRKEKFSKQ